MFNNNGMRIVAYAFMFVSLMMLVGNFAYAQKEPKGPELPEHAEAVMPPECPTCKTVHASHTKGRVTAPMVMSCPDCKKETTEIGVYHCSKCEKEFLTCINCLAASKAKAETRCPKCKKVLVRQIKGKIGAHVKWEMKCPDCKEKPEEWLRQHCDECEVDFLACPLCKK
jgi:DNA-directed RNA polymerase subunit RPC12/RpoP